MQIEKNEIQNLQQEAIKGPIHQPPHLYPLFK